jgi:hypothetical protein
VEIGNWWAITVTVPRRSSRSIDELNRRIRELLDPAPIWLPGDDGAWCELKPRGDDRLLASILRALQAMSKELPRTRFVITVEPDREDTLTIRAGSFGEQDAAVRAFLATIQPPVHRVWTVLRVMGTGEPATVASIAEDLRITLASKRYAIGTFTLVAHGSQLEFVFTFSADGAGAWHIIHAVMSAMAGRVIPCEVVLDGREPIQRTLDGWFDWGFLRDEVRG